MTLAKEIRLDSNLFSGPVAAPYIANPSLKVKDAPRMDRTGPHCTAAFGCSPLNWMRLDCVLVILLADHLTARE